jgi:tetratricopeptide (TPR) repeat protein
MAVFLKMNVEEKFRSAFSCHQSGNLQMAESLYREILLIYPDNPSVLHLLGVVLLQLGKYGPAIENIKKSLRLAGNNAEAYNHLGTALKAKGLVDEAITSFRRAIELNPHFADAYFNLGNTLVSAGRLDEAIVNYQRAAVLKPDFFAAYFNLGKAFQERGDTDEAIASYGRALELSPDSADICNALGLLYQHKGQLDEAIIYFRKAISLNPGFAGTYVNLGEAVLKKGHPAEAIGHYKEALKLNSDPSFLADLYNNMGVAYQETGNFDEALASYRRSLELAPDKPGIYKNIGTVLHDKGNFYEAMVYYRKAIELDPADAETYCNLGSVVEDMGQPDEAMTFYLKALMIDPSLAEAHWNISLAQLKSGNFEEGWKNYEWRLLKKGARPSYFSEPLWEGSPLSGKTLVVTAEQGIGDEIMFASCLPNVIEKAEMCSVECDKRLVPLFSRSFPRARFFERISSESFKASHQPEADFKIAIGSLPKFFRNSLADFPRQQAYLFPEERKVDFWRKRYSEKGPGLKTGISWRGGSKPAVRLARSTVLEQWKHLLSVPGVHFINLQYGDCTNELREAKEKLGVTIHHWDDADPLRALDGFAAQVAALDLVISVDNATVHMAGALGVPAWALLPFACDWRWMMDFEDTPWYESVRLFRQTRHGDWNDVFERVTSGLRQYISTGVVPETDRRFSYKAQTVNRQVLE